MAKKRILVVDDTTDISTPLKMYLEKTGAYDVRVESLGAKALGAAKEFKPDLILLDVVMPDVDGGDVSAMLEEDPETAKIPVVLLTASVTKQEASERGGVIGGRPVLSKLTSMKEIIEFVKRHLGA